MTVISLNIFFNFLLILIFCFDANICCSFCHWCDLYCIVVILETFRESQDIFRKFCFHGSPFPLMQVLACLLAWHYLRCILFLGKCGIFVLILWDIWYIYWSKCHFASLLFHRLYFPFNTEYFITNMEVAIRSYIWNKKIWTIAIIFLKYKFQIHWYRSNK